MLRFLRENWDGLLIFGAAAVGSVLVLVLISRPLRDIVDNPADPERSTVVIATDRGVAGTGVVVSARHVLTAAHVVAGRYEYAAYEVPETLSVPYTESNTAAALRGGNRLTVVLWIERFDMAVLRAEREFDVPVAQFASPVAGEKVVLWGAPAGLYGTRTEGVVSAIRYRPDGVEMVQTDAVVQPGTSGAGVWNAKGELIGLVSYGMVQGFRSVKRFPSVVRMVGLNFAVSADILRPVVEAAVEVDTELGRVAQ